MIDKVKELLSKYYSEEEINRVIEGYQVDRYTTLRINTIKTTKEEIVKVLDSEGIKYQEVDWYKDALIILNKKEEDLVKLSIYNDGLIYLQSLSSMILQERFCGLQGGNWT